MQKIENAEYFHARQACYLCLQPHDCVDTEVQIEGEGVLALCRNCIGTLAETAGFELRDQQDTIDRLREELRLALERETIAKDEAGEMAKAYMDARRIEKARRENSKVKA